MGTGELSGKWQPDEMLKGDLAEDWLLIWGRGGGGREKQCNPSCFMLWKLE